MFDLKKPKGGKPLHGISIKEMAVNPDYTPKARTWVVDTQRSANLAKWKNAAVLQDVIKDGKIEHKWRLVRGKDGGKFEVFDFAGDRAQKKDLIKDQAEVSAAVVKELSGVYDEWWTEISAGQEAFPPSVLGVAEEQPGGSLPSWSVRSRTRCPRGRDRSHCPCRLPLLRGRWPRASGP